MSQVICNKTYKCEYEGACDHRKPHKPDGHGCDLESGGTSLYCQQGKMKSICVPIESGRYQTSERKWCSCNEPKCNGTWVEILSRSIEERPK